MKRAGRSGTPEFVPKPMGGIYVEPGTQGGTNWYPPSYSPRTGLFYVAVWDNYGGRSSKFPVPPWVEGQRYTGATAPPGYVPPPGARGRGVPVPFRKEEEGYRRDPCARSEDGREEVGLQDGQLHGVRRALDRW